MRKNNVRKTKTDKVDTFIIAKTLMMQDSLRFITLKDLDYIELKELGRFWKKTVKQRTRLKIQLTSYMDQVFPELQYFFKSGMHKNSVYALLKEAPTPNNINSMHMTHLTCLHSVIMTLPGIGSTNGGMILGEIGDIHRFSTLGKLLAFAELDPSVYQSRNFQVQRTRMSKRGSHVLRYTLMNAAHNVVKYNATFKAYYDAKRAKGWTYYNVLGTVSVSLSESSGRCSLSIRKIFFC